ncbi:hypothetical protein T05_15645 [Trichinella murrelli]|uniref:Uncharacterized protein n=1 Tax=Trichinella murrelli TaxID=144512 RepID=A0A0V0TB05_9BILA|nr:hypothetical protein T05_15645 [Trichinella murrelli]
MSAADFLLAYTLFSSSGLSCRIRSLQSHDFTIFYHIDEFNARRGSVFIMATLFKMAHPFASFDRALVSLLGPLVLPVGWPWLLRTDSKRFPVPLRHDS